MSKKSKIKKRRKFKKIKNNRRIVQQNHDIPRKNIIELKAENNNSEEIFDEYKNSRQNEKSNSFYEEDKKNVVEEIPETEANNRSYLEKDEISKEKILLIGFNSERSTNQNTQEDDLDDFNFLKSNISESLKNDDEDQFLDINFDNIANLSNNCQQRLTPNQNNLSNSGQEPPRNNLNGKSSAGMKVKKEKFG